MKTIKVPNTIILPLIHHAEIRTIEKGHEGLLLIFKRDIHLDIVTAILDVMEISFYESDVDDETKGLLISLYDIQEEWLPFVTAVREDKLDEFSIDIWQQIIDANGNDIKEYKPLKSPEAEKLRLQKEIIIDGEVIHLWTHHTYDSVQVQNSWNRLSDTVDVIDEHTRICITGVFQIPRDEVKKIASKNGVRVVNSISKKTNYLVCGTENASPNKISSARKLGVKIINEIEFLESLL